MKNFDINAKDASGKFLTRRKMTKGGFHQLQVKLIADFHNAF